MNSLLDTIRRQLSDYFEGKSKKQKAVMGIIAAVVILGICIAAALVGKEEYVVLYSGLDEAEAGEILELLNEDGVAAKGSGSGTILVLSETADEVRMDLAAKGYPETGLNYDIFSNSSAFGTTDLQAKTYLQYQLQENLRATINKLERIEDCVVIVTMEPESLFVLSKEQNGASASVMLEVKGRESLSIAEVEAIANLVLKSVSGLKLENISIVDSAMNLYDVTGEQDEQVYTASQYELTEMVKETVVEQVLSLLTPVFGEENVSAAANVVLDFDKETVVSSDFDTPKEDSENGLVVSMEELYEMAQGDGSAEGTAGTDSNGIGISEYVYEGADIDDFMTISRTINYELNQTQTQIEKQQGKIEALSVAVLLNSDSYDEDYAESISNLVSKAIGVEKESISVETMPFKETAGESDISGVFEEQASLMESMKNKEIVKMVIISLTVMVLSLLFFLFLKSMMKGRVSPQGQAALQGAGNADAFMEGEDGDGDNVFEEIIGPGKSQRIESIEKFIDKNPAAAAQLLRNWLSDDND